MRLLIDTSGVQFRVAGAVKPRPDFKDKERQATTKDGRPIWIAAPGRDRRRARDQGDHLGRGGRRRAQADL